jgi:site-specific DNA-cytosine methylase
VSVFVKATNPHSAEEAPRFEETQVAACLNGWDERHNPPKHMAVAVDIYNQTTNETSQALSSSASDIHHTGGCINPSQAMAVRRLTPRECERLQGFKDDHTLIPWRGKPAEQCPDGPRYKALGNSMAVPCMAWIGKRIAAQEMFPLRYLSVCSGIEAASAAWETLGWQPAAFSEIEKFPSAVLAHHWPDVPNLGDMTQYEQWKELGAIDLMVGGTPCQSFSVAGLRQGLRDPRGGLMLTYLEIASKFPASLGCLGKRPRRLVFSRRKGFWSLPWGAGGIGVWVGLPSLGRSVVRSGPAPSPCVRCRKPWRRGRCRKGSI